jgi:TolB-like protein
LAEGNEPDAVGGAGAAAPGASIDLHSGAVFISYASSDSAIADSVVASLERHGVGCWIAPRDVRAGSLYAEAIVRAISNSKALVLVLSTSSVASAHVGKEVERASSKRRPVIALRIDEAPLSPALEYFLSESHWVDARAESMDAGIGKVIAAIRELERNVPEVISIGSTDATAGTASAARPKARNRILIAAGVIVLAVALAALLAEHLTAQRQATAAANVNSDKTIAVLPFADMSEKHDQEYFSDGLAEELAGLLGKIPGMRVIGTTSSFQFKQPDSDARSIAHRLGASYLVQGGVRRSGDHIRVTARLLDGRSGEQIWSDSYDREVSDVLKVQEDITTGLARALQIAVDTELSVKQRPLKSPEAHDLYLRGLNALDKGTHPAVIEAVADLEQALSLDPDYAAAAVSLAEAYMSAGSEAWILPDDAYPKARHWAEHEVLQSQGVLPRQQVTFLSDGGDTVRELPAFLHPHSEHILDWFHIAMRVEQLSQTARGFRGTDD